MARPGGWRRRPALDSEPISEGPALPERVAENNNLAYAKKRGLICRKMNGLGFRDWPDRLFIGKGVIFWIEYKVRGKGPTPNQAKLHEVLRGWGQHVYVVDDKNVGREIINYEINNPGGPPWQK